MGDYQWNYTESSYNVNIKSCLILESKTFSNSSKTVSVIFQTKQMSKLTSNITSKYSECSMKDIISIRDNIMTFFWDYIKTFFRKTKC